MCWLRAPFYVLRVQVLSLSNNGISACLVGGSSNTKTEDKAMAGEFPLVFITPEKVIATAGALLSYAM